MKASKTVAAVMAAATLGAGAACAQTGFVASVSGVTLTQRENTRIVDIGYTLAGEDAIITLAIETNGVAIPDSAVTRLSGDVCKVVQQGTNSIVWNAGADWPEHAVTNARARVTAWSTNAPPLYCAVNVTAGSSAGTGDYPVFYYSSAEAVPDGVTNHLYKTCFILMRRIDPTGGNGFLMGSPPSESGRNEAREAQANVKLTKPYYIGVYEVTQQQWQQVSGDVLSWPAYFTDSESRLTRPVEQVSYEDIRGNKDAGYDWPTNGYAVLQNSFTGRLRSRTGLDTFDLPPEAQWEWACRAGTTGSYNVPDKTLAELGRYADNGGNDGQPGDTTDKGTAAAGSYLPNAWGLYDMHGNVWEWCLNWYTDAIDGGENPEGADSDSIRVVRGGSRGNSASDCRSARRGYGGPSDRDNSFGFRLVRTLP